MRVTADEDTILHDRFGFSHSVIVTGDGAGADVHAFADLRIAEVAEMIGLRTFTLFGFLDFDEISDLRPFAHDDMRTEVGEWSQRRIVFNL